MNFILFQYFKYGKEKRYLIFPIDYKLKTVANQIVIVYPRSFLKNFNSIKIQRLQIIRMMFHFRYTYINVKKIF